MPVGRISRGLARAERARQGLVLSGELHPQAYGSAPFSPMEFAPDLVCWYDANALNMNPGAPVTYMVDLSGNGYGAVVTGTPPAFKLVVGRPCLEFTTTPGGLVAALGAVQWANTAVMTMFVVLRNEQVTDDNSEHWAFQFWNGASVGASTNSIGGLECGNMQSTFNNFAAHGNGGSSQIIHPTLSTDVGKHIVSFVCNGNASSMSVDGVTVAAPAGVAPQLPFVNVMIACRAGGGDRTFMGEWYEGFIIMKALDTVTLGRVTRELGKKHGILVP